jgi:hypothetical protein
VDAAVVLEALFEEVPIELCRYAVPLPDGGVILAVRDDAVLGGGAGLMRFDKDWRPDLSFAARIEAADQRTCLTLKLQPDGKLLVAGLIGKLNGEDFSGVARLDEQGAIDRSFRCQATNCSPFPGSVPAVMDLAIQKDGRIVICGYFLNVNGAECPHIARLNPDGSLDGTFRTPLLTLEQFNRERFARMRRVPVAQLAKAAETFTPAGAGATVPEAAPQTILITAMSFQGDAALIQFSGTPRQQYILQAKDSMAADWINVGTNQANADGVGRLLDAEANEHAMRFYRVASP